MSDAGRLTMERLMRYVTPISLIALVAAVWDGTASIREIKTILVYQGKQRDEDRAETRREFDEIKSRIAAVEGKK